jgi:hypothetical protein
MSFPSVHVWFACVFFAPRQLYRAYPRIGKEIPSLYTCVHECVTWRAWGGGGAGQALGMSSLNHADCVPDYSTLTPKQVHRAHLSVCLCVRTLDCACSISLLCRIAGSISLCVVACMYVDVGLHGSARHSTTGRRTISAGIRLWVQWVRPPPPATCSRTTRKRWRGKRHRRTSSLCSTVYIATIGHTRAHACTCAQADTHTHKHSCAHTHGHTAPGHHAQGRPPVLWPQASIVDDGEAGHAGRHCCCRRCAPRSMERHSVQLVGLGGGAQQGARARDVLGHAPLSQLIIDDQQHMRFHRAGDQPHQRRCRVGRHAAPMLAAYRQLVRRRGTAEVGRAPLPVGDMCLMPRVTARVPQRQQRCWVTRRPARVHVDGSVGGSRP